MNLKKTVFLVLLIFVLFACSDEEPAVQEPGNINVERLEGIYSGVRGSTLNIEFFVSAEEGISAISVEANNEMSKFNLNGEANYTVNFPFDIVAACVSCNWSS